MDIKIRTKQLNTSHLLVDVYYNHVAKIKQDKKILKSTREKYAQKLVRKQIRLLSATLNKPKRSALVSDGDKQLVAKENWQQLSFINPHRVIPCQEATLRALEAYRIPLEGMSAFTIIDRNYETSDTIFEKEAKILAYKNSNNTKNTANKVDLNFDTIKKKLQLGLWGYSYIGVLEFAIFRNELYKDKNPNNNGFLIAPHLQGLIWKDGGIIEKDTDYLEAMFPTGGRWDAKGFKHERIYDVTGSASYMHKLPLFAYLNNYRHTSEQLTQDIAFVIFNRLKHVTFDKMFISGGEGQNVRTVTLNYLKKHYQKYK